MIKYKKQSAKFVQQQQQQQKWNSNQKWSVQLYGRCVQYSTLTFVINTWAQHRSSGEKLKWDAHETQRYTNYTTRRPCHQN